MDKINKIKFTIPVLIVSFLALFIAVFFGLREKINSIPKPFLCNGQPCNVILIIPETLSARHMGIYGYERDTTPFIDEFFGKEGIVFENAWSNAPWTLPSFASLFTSRLPSEVYVERLTDKLSKSLVSFVDVLNTAEVPKFVAHNRALPSVAGEDRGFFTRFDNEERFQGEDPFLFLRAAEWIKEQVSKNGEQPFFLLLQPYAPHNPYHPPEPYRYYFDAPLEYPGPVTPEDVRETRKDFWEGEEVEEEKLRRFRLQYDQEIRYLDSEVESFISRLPEEVLQTTVFIFTSDHGEAFGQHDNMAHGRTLYEEEIHIPFLVKIPGVEQEKIREPVTLLDIGPTILEIFGLKSPESFRGISLLLTIKGEMQIESRIVKAEGVPEAHPLEGEWSEIEPYVRKEPLPHPIEKAVRKESWKLLKRADDSLELYNLERDYNEQDNLIPRWHDLSQEEQAEALPLFEAVGESPPL